MDDFRKLVAEKHIEIRGQGWSIVSLHEAYGVLSEKLSYLLDEMRSDEPCADKIRHALLMISAVSEVAAVDMHLAEISNTEEKEKEREFRRTVAEFMFTVVQTQINHLQSKYDANKAIVDAGKISLVADRLAYDKLKETLYNELSSS